MDWVLFEAWKLLNECCMFAFRVLDEEREQIFMVHLKLGRSSFFSFLFGMIWTCPPQCAIPTVRDANSDCFLTLPTHGMDSMDSHVEDASVKSSNQLGQGGHLLSNTFRCLEALAQDSRRNPPGRSPQKRWVLVETPVITGPSLSNRGNPSTYKKA